MEQAQVAVRETDKGDIGAMPLDEFKKMAQRSESRTRELTMNKWHILQYVSNANGHRLKSVH